MHDKARAFYDLGIKNISANKPEALKAFLQALALYRQLAEESPSTYLRFLGTTLNNLGGLYSEMHQYEEALKYLDEALVIRHKLAREYPGCLPDVAMSWANMGVCCKQLGAFEKAEHALLEAAKIYRAFTDRRFETRLSRLLWTLEMLANVYNATAQVEKLEQTLDEALTIHRQFAAAHSRQALADLADFLLNLSTFYKNTQRPEQASVTQLEALQILADLRSENP